MNLVIEPHGSWVWGVPTTRDVRLLQGEGWAVGTKFKPGAFTALTGIEASKICGYVLKSAAERDLVEACRAATRGETFLYPPTVRALLRAWLDDPRRAPTSELTAREEEVVKLVAESHTSEQIAELLHISRRTVERHRENILAKLGLTDRIQLTRYAIRRGLIDA